MTEPARSAAQRKKDSLSRLQNDKDFWVATASGDTPTMVPLSFWWSGESLFFATVENNPTAVNIVSSGRARAVLGHTRDVVLLDTVAKRIERDELSETYADAYARKCGWDPRDTRDYRFFQLSPERIESWRELNEHSDRELMRDRKWLI